MLHHRGVQGRRQQTVALPENLAKLATYRGRTLLLARRSRCPSPPARSPATATSPRTSAAYGILGKALLAVVALSIVVGGWSALGQEEEGSVATAATAPQNAPPAAAPGAGDSVEQADPPQLELATGTDDDAETLASLGSAIQGLFSIEEGAQLGLTFLLLGFGISSLLKIAQGSSTVAMITASSMLAGVATTETLGFHPVYLGIAIGAGSLVGSWMNDSGFWIFAKMSGLTEGEALRSWTTALIVLGVTSFLLSVLGA